MAFVHRAKLWPGFAKYFKKRSWVIFYVQGLDADVNANHEDEEDDEEDDDEDVPG